MFIWSGMQDQRPRGNGDVLQNNEGQRFWGDAENTILIRDKHNNSLISEG